MTCKDTASYGSSQPCIITPTDFTLLSCPTIFRKRATNYGSLLQKMTYKDRFIFCYHVPRENMKPVQFWPLKKSSRFQTPTQDLWRHDYFIRIYTLGLSNCRYKGMRSISNPNPRSQRHDSCVRRYTLGVSNCRCKGIESISYLTSRSVKHIDR